MDPGTYVMAAAIAEIDNIEGLRQTMRSLRLPGQRKVHWHVESGDRRTKLVDAVADMAVEGFVVARVGAHGERDERRRRKCLETLVCEVGELGCEELILESRGPADDRRDRGMLDSMRRSKTLRSPLRMSHAPGPNDPMLWVPDIICGALVQERLGEPRFLDRLRARTTVRVIDARR